MDSPKNALAAEGMRAHDNPVGTLLHVKANILTINKVEIWILLRYGNKVPGSGRFDGSDAERRQAAAA
jgi:hypothetical protein